MHHKYMDKNSKMRHPAQKSLFFAYFCAGKQLAGDEKNGPFGNVIREDPGAARRRVRRVGNAALRRETAGPLALRETRRGPDADERHRRGAPREAGRTLPPRIHPARADHRIGRRNEKSTSTARSRAHGSNRPTFPTASGPRCASRRRPDAAWDANSARRDGRGCNTR